MWPFKKKEQSAYIGYFQFEVDNTKMLAKYNAEVSRGIMHTEEWKDKMKVLQEEYDKYIINR